MRSERSGIDKLALVTGVIFVLVGVSHVLGEANDRHLDPAWVLAAVLVALGAAGLSGALRSRSGPAEEPEDTRDTTYDEPRREGDSDDDTLILGN